MNKSINKCVFLTNQLSLKPTGGREMLSKLNYDVLTNIYSNSLAITEVVKQPILGVRQIINAFMGHIDGVNPDVINKIIQVVGSQNISKLIVDGSNFGCIVEEVKKKYPDIHIATIFHNVEVRFFWGSFKQIKTAQSFAVMCANYIAEKKSVNFSDNLICLNKRDSELLGRIYGRKATHISEIALEDKLPSNFKELIISSQEKYILFVGGDFYANRVGISWFVKNVASKIDFKVCIVGKGLEHYRDELELVANVHVIGAVDSLAEWYLNAHFVIAPIFDGSGMKTKVAEALMYGKKVIGTPEAFAGYEEIVQRVGVVCKTEDDFVCAIAEANIMVITDFDQDLRDIYEKKYSFEAAKVRLMNILDFES